MENFYKKNSKKTGVLLVNLGTPDAPTPKALRRYLKEFLSDRRVIEANPLLWQLILRGIILPIRSPKSAKNYAKIWNKQHNKSPLLVGMEQLTDALKHHNDIDNLDIRFAMRYGTPSIPHVIQDMVTNNCHDIIILPLYPQYSATTTASIYDAVYHSVAPMRFQPTLRYISPYFDNKHYIDALCRHIKPYLQHNYDTLLFLYHGLPQEYFDKGDPYHCHCHKTTRLIKEQLQIDDDKVSLAFQSRFGPKKWLQPYADGVLQDLAKQGKNILVISPGFSMDCIETLEEICIGYRELFMEHGGGQFTYIPCLNATPIGVNMVQNIIHDNLKGWFV